MTLQVDLWLHRSTHFHSFFSVVGILKLVGIEWHQILRLQTKKAMITSLWIQYLTSFSA